MLEKRSLAQERDIERRLFVSVSMCAKIPRPLAPPPPQLKVRNDDLEVDVARLDTAGARIKASIAQKMRTYGEVSAGGGQAGGLCFVVPEGLWSSSWLFITKSQSRLRSACQAWPVIPLFGTIPQSPRPVFPPPATSLPFLLGACFLRCY